MILGRQVNWPTVTYNRTGLDPAGYLAYLHTEII